MLVIDTNILARCSVGNAMSRLLTLSARGVAVSTTDENKRELWGVLTGKLGVPEDLAAAETALLTMELRVISWDEYAHLEQHARRRLRQGGEKDWPALAAALALDAQIWSDDTDFFGVGVPVWSTPNVHLAPADRGPNR